MLASAFARCEWALSLCSALWVIQMSISLRVCSQIIQAKCNAEFFVSC